MIACPACARYLPPASIAADGTAQCPSCATMMDIVLYPALLRPTVRGAMPERLLGAGDAACYYHHGNVAAAACAECGAYVCALCDIGVGLAHYCPSCFNNKHVPASKHRGILLHDHTAFILAVIGVVAVPLMFAGILYGPAIIAYSLYQWNRVHTPYPRSRWRFVAAIMLASVATLFSLIFFGTLITTKLIIPALSHSPH